MLSAGDEEEGCDSLRGGAEGFGIAVVDVDRTRESGTSGRLPGVRTSGLCEAPRSVSRVATRLPTSPVAPVAPVMPNSSDTRFVLGDGPGARDSARAGRS
jgi:hypothetical protein